MKETVSHHEMECHQRSEKIASYAASPEKIVIAASDRIDMVPENGDLEISPVKPNTQLPFPEESAAEEPRASPPVADTDQAPSTSQVRNDVPELKDVFINGMSVNDHLVSEEDSSRGVEPELPFTPTKKSIDAMEPILPSTPTQLGLEAPPAPPKGLIYATSPRKSRRKRKIVHKTSPLKLSNSMNTEKVDKIPYVSKLGPRIPVVKIRRSSRIITLGTESSISHIMQPDAGSSKPSKSVVDAENPHQDLFQQPSSLAECLARYLPFSKAVSSIRTMDPLQNLLAVRASQPPDISRAESQCHLPLPSSLTAIDRPSRSISSPNMIKVADSLDPSRSIDASSQLLNINLVAPQQLLAVSIQLEVNTATGNSIDMKITSISSWADPELGSWLREGGQSLHRTTIERAVQSYWETSLIRASCWQRCEEEIGEPRTSPIHQFSINNPEIIQLEPKPPQKQNPVPLITERSPRTTSAVLPTPSPASTANNSGPNTINPLQPHLGRQSLLFTQPPISLLFSWHITFTPDGTVQNRISAHPAFPKRWLTGTEEGLALGRVDEAFDALLARKGVFESVKELCGRIFVR